MLLMLEASVLGFSKPENTWHPEQQAE